MTLSKKDLELYAKYSKLSNPIIEVEMDILGKIYTSSYGELDNGNYIKKGKLNKKDINRIIKNKLFRNSKDKGIKELPNNKKLIYIHLL